MLPGALPLQQTMLILTLEKRKKRSALAVYLPILTHSHWCQLLFKTPAHNCKLLGCQSWTCSMHTYQAEWKHQLDVKSRINQHHWHDKQHKPMTRTISLTCFCNMTICHYKTNWFALSSFVLRRFDYFAVYRVLSRCSWPCQLIKHFIISMTSTRLPPWDSCNRKV